MSLENAALIYKGNLITGGGSSQVSTMPVYSSVPVGTIVQYVGATTQDYTNGFFYKATANGWENVDVQETIIDDATPASGTTYSSEKVEELVGSVESDVQDIRDKISTEYTVEHPKILIRKGKNILLNIPEYSSGTHIFADLRTLLPSHKYYLWCKPSTSLVVNSWSWFPWNATWRGDDLFAGTVSTDGQWIYFSTSSSFPTTTTTAFLNVGNGVTFENMCVVKEEDWNENLDPITDNTGYYYTLNCTLSANDGCKDKLVQRDGDWYKTTTRDGVVIAESRLGGDDSNILSAVANLIKNNSAYGYEFSLMDEYQNKVSDLSDLEPESIDYLHTSDYRFMHKDKEFIMHSITLAHEGCLDYGNSADLSTSKFRPFVYFDAVSLGFDTIQVSIQNGAFHNGTSLRDPSEYAVFVQAMDFATALGLRIIFKFYTFAWGNATTIANTMAVEKLIVNLFKDYANVVGYSIANEPSNNGYVDSNATIKARYEDFVSEMQKFINDNTKQIVFVEKKNGIDFALPNVSYEFHMYEPHLFTHNAKCAYPDLKAVWVRDGSGGGNKYVPDIPSQYPINKQVSSSDEFAWQSSGLYSRMIYQNRDSIFINTIRFDNFAKVGETFDIKAYSFKFYDAEQNIVDEYTVTFDENTSLDKYYLKAWTNPSQQTDLSSRKAEFLSVVQDGTDYVLRFSVPDENTFKYIQLSKAPYATSDYYDQWRAGWFDDVVYIEFQVLTRAKSDIPDSTSLIKIDSSVTCLFKDVYTFVPSQLKREIKQAADSYRSELNVPLWVGESGTRQETMMKSAPLNGFGWLKDVFENYQELGLSYSHFIYSGSGFGIYNTSSLAGIFYPTTNNTVDVVGELATLREINTNKYIPNDGYSFTPAENDFRPLLSHGAWKKFESIIDDTNPSSSSTYSSEKIEKLVPFVTPEKFGAVGDGVKDDTAAFTAAFAACKHVICDSSKTYYFSGTVDASSLREGVFDMNGATFYNLHMKIGMKNAYQPIVDTSIYPFKIVNGILGKWSVIDSGWETPVFICGTALQMENLHLLNTPHLLAITNSYRDLMIFRNIHFSINSPLWDANTDTWVDAVSMITENGDFVRFNVDDVTNTPAQVNGLAGDGWVVEQVSECRDILNQGYGFIHFFRNQPIIINQCVQSKFFVGRFSKATFNGCHFEDVRTMPEVLTLKTHPDVPVSAPWYMCFVIFDNCYFYDTYVLEVNHPEVVYRNCYFRCASQAVHPDISLATILGGEDFYSMQCGVDRCVFDNYMIDSREMQHTMSQPKHTRSWKNGDTQYERPLQDAISSTKTLDEGTNPFPQTGTYHYKAFTFASGTDIAHESYEWERTVPSLQCAYDSTGRLGGHQGGWKFEIYRTLPNGEIERCRFYMPVYPQINSDEYVYFDDYGLYVKVRYGKIKNSVTTEWTLVIPWIQVSAIPTYDINAKLYEKNGVLVTTDNSKITQAVAAYWYVQVPDTYVAQT